MRVSTMALVGAVLCWVVAFVAVPILALTKLPNPGFLSPTISGLVLMGVWARYMARGR